MHQEADDVDADKSFRFNKTLVDLKLSKSVRIDINLLYFVMIFLDSVM